MHVDGGRGLAGGEACDVVGFSCDSWNACTSMGLIRTYADFRFNGGGGWRMHDLLKLRMIYTCRFCSFFLGYFSTPE